MCTHPTAGHDDHLKYAIIIDSVNAHLVVIWSGMTTWWGFEGIDWRGWRGVYRRDEPFRSCDQHRWAPALLRRCSLVYDLQLKSK